MSHQSKLAALMLVSFGAGHAQAQGDLAWRPGDTWSYQQEDMWNKQVLGRTVLSVTAKVDGSLVLRTEGGALAFDEQVAPDGTHERPRVGLIGPFAHTPVRFPLKVGDQWQSTSFFQHYQGDVRKREVTCQAKRQEAVKLTIGSFDSVLVECSGSWRSLQGAAGRYEIRLWYSPDVRWLVRAEEKNWRAAVGGSGLDMQVAHVLTSYRLGP